MPDGPDFGKQIGPLPLGAWVAVIAGGLGIALYSRGGSGGNASDSPQVVEDIGTPDGVGTGAVGGWTQTSPTPTATETVDSSPANNEEWGRRAINRLISEGYNPAWSYTAITKALAGGTGDQAMSAREYSIWNEALRLMGTPPTPLNVPPPTSIPTGDDAPGTAPTTGTTPTTRPTTGSGGGGLTPVASNYKHAFKEGGKRDGLCAVCGKGRYNPIHVKANVIRAAPSPGTFKYANVTPAPLRGSNLKSLSTIYYGTDRRWNDIYNANKKGTRRADGSPGVIDNPNKLKPGMRLIIPR